MALRILMTGASGLVGGEVAGRLLDRGHAVTAIVRRTRAIRRNDGSALPATDWRDAPPDGRRLAVIEGDLRRPLLGLERGNAIARAHDLLVHCAAATGFGLDDAEYAAVNVAGTRNALDLARSGAIPMLHVSTAYVCGVRDGPVLETELDLGQRFANGYEASKAEAERLLRASGHPVAVARPGIVVGEWRSGAIRGFDTIYAAFRLITEGRIRVMPATPDATLDFVPIDHVAAGLVALAERIGRAAGRTFHLVSGAPVTVGMFRDAIADFPQFAVPTFADPAGFDPAALPPAERRLHAAVAAMYASYFQRSPRFDDRAMRALSGRTCPPTDPAFLRRLIRYCIKARFLRPPRGQGANGVDLGAAQPSYLSPRT